MNTVVDKETSEAWHAVAHWYHSFFTGMVLSSVTRQGTSRAAELVYQVFCRQRSERFLQGLAKLGIDELPPAVAAAQYHYLSNNIGGVCVEYMYESDRKAWVRYMPPRWIWSGTALCGIPSEVSAAMLRGWHAQNGVTLGNPRLGFVCTKQTADGQSGLEGYYYEYDEPLAPHERLRFARHEDAPDFDPAAAPTLPSSDWPQARIEKASRNYAMEYVRSTLPTAVDLFGPSEAVSVLRLSARQVAMQCYHETAARLGVAQDKSLHAFVDFLARLARAQGDEVTVQETTDGYAISQRGWTLFGQAQVLHPAVFDIWNGLLEGAADAHNHRLALSVTHKDLANGRFAWHVRGGV